MIIGITGGISCGKSTVSRMFAKKGTYIIDADEINRDLQERGNIGWEKIVDHFGSDILIPYSGFIDRNKLSEIVFSDKKKLDILNSIMHPLVKEVIRKKTEIIKETEHNAIIIWDIPLLIETNLNNEVDKIVVVHTSVDNQISRLMKRNNLDYASALSRINSQMSSKEKCKYADFIIDNSKLLEFLEVQVDLLFNHFKILKRK